MPISFHEFAQDALPNLSADNYRITSPTTWDYNCIAWALGITDAWWWPVPGRYWPENVPREETVQAFLAMFATQRYSVSASLEVEAGLEKVVLYTAETIPTHAARQLADGWWTSKLGPSFDVEHAHLEALAGGVYGEPAVILSRETLP